MGKKRNEEIPDKAEDQATQPVEASEQEELQPKGDHDGANTTDTSATDALINEMNDRYLRLYAEFENYKKRTMRERLQLMETAGSKTMKALFPVLDDFDRARKAAESDEAKLAEYESGVGLIVKKLYNSLKSLGLEPMESTGADFDADKHEAITEIPNPEMAGKVVDTVEKGYTLNGNIIRYAKVVVGK